MVKLIIIKHILFFGFWFFYYENYFMVKKQLKRIVNIIEKIMQTRGIRPQREVLVRNLGPPEQSLVWLLGITCGMVDWVYHGPHPAAFRLDLEATCQASAWACMVERLMEAAWEYFTTKIMQYVGGPGNRTQVPAFTKYIPCQVSCEARL